MRVNLGQRIAATAAPFVLLPLFFAGAVLWAIRRTDADREAEIIALTARVAELEAEVQSDITIRLELNYAVYHHPDHAEMHAYSVVIENVGPNELKNCVLMLSTANMFNIELHDRSWLKEASETFDLRRGQVKTLPILWVQGENPDAEAYPHRHPLTDHALWPENHEGEIIPSDQTYYMFVEVLSANTQPARLAIRIWNEEDGWQLECVPPGTTLTFPDD